jgi:hypothetical protein
VSESRHQPAPPVAFDVVEIIDRPSATRVSATVESASEHVFVLHLEYASRLPEEALVRWFDGATAWEAIAQLDAIDGLRIACRLENDAAWQPAPARRSPRIPVDMAAVVVKIVDSRVIAKGRRVNAVCVDVSQTGCRTSWLGTQPRLRDAVDIAWTAAAPAGREPEWLPARVARIIARPFGATQISFAFDVANTTDTARVNSVYRAWLHEYHRRNAA